jgi:hypothetical protein
MVPSSRKGIAEVETRFQHRQRVANEIAFRLLAETYEHLRLLADDEAQSDAFLTRYGFDIHRPPYVSLMVSEGGLFRKRLFVEITVRADPTDRHERPGCVYFEKHQNGKLVVYGLGTENPDGQRAEERGEQ